MNRRLLIAFIGFLAIALGGVMTGCGNKLKPNAANAASGDDGNPGSGIPASSVGSGSMGSETALTTNSGAYWHGCKYFQGETIISCTEEANITTSPSSCPGAEFVDACPSTGLVAKCTIKDPYSIVVRINYEYTGTLHDAALYTVIQPGETFSCGPG